MGFSDKTPEDKQKLKNGIMGVLILVGLGMGGPWIMGAMTGVDSETLCVEREGLAPICPEGEDAKYAVETTQLVFQLYIPLTVFVLGVVAFLIIGIKY